LREQGTEQGTTVKAEFPLTSMSPHTAASSAARCGAMVQLRSPPLSSVDSVLAIDTCIWSPCWYRVHGCSFRIYELGLRILGSVFMVQGTMYRVQGSGFRVCGS